MPGIMMTADRRHRSSSKSAYELGTEKGGADESDFICFVLRNGFYILIYDVCE